MINPSFAVSVLLAGTLLAQSKPPALKASMIVVGVSDLSLSAKFYGQVLALPTAPAPGDLPMFQSGDLTIVLNSRLSPSGSGFELVFPVESVGVVRKELTDRGCKFVGDSREVAPNMWAATFNDPDGHHLTLFGAR